MSNQQLITSYFRPENTQSTPQQNNNSSSSSSSSNPSPQTFAPKLCYTIATILYLISTITTGVCVGFYWKMHEQAFNTNAYSGSVVCGFKGSIMNSVASISRTIVIVGMVSGLFYMLMDGYRKGFVGYLTVKLDSALFMGLHMVLALAIVCTDAMSWIAMSNANHDSWANTSRITLAVGGSTGLLFCVLHPLFALLFKGARDKFKLQR
ncbi:hypothetical protein BX070DRAFT_217983 [Coemansia spiralis]|nr:hypothetical protein BX070DRAFT_217983 [Coemansia spiralis]